MKKDVNPLTETGTNLSEAALQQEKTKSQVRPTGLAKGEFVVPDDFDSPLPETILRTFEDGEDR